MTIDEAIKITESLLDGTYDHRDENMEDALMLGIGALQRIEWYRSKYRGSINELLPGETEE
ncbi:hypothetical protein LCGC14_1774100 [marine sediment metagenome]|uniref:Uncharacterized protein n=1 Tax=marine sediment metagenome TaxID=412755 RepID=A0A0F9JCB2_9ZZZZ